MRKTLLLIASVFLLTASVYAQTQKSSFRSPIPPQPAKDVKSPFKVHVMPTLPASVTNDDPLTPYTEKIKVPKSKIPEWLFIHVAFPVANSTSDVPWIDDLEVTAELGIPGRNKKDGAQFIILHGSQLLNPIRADGGVHNVRFFVPPYAIYRYIVDENGGSPEKIDYKKLAQELPVVITFRWRGAVISRIVREGKSMSAADRVKIVKEFAKLSDTKSRYYENVILPAESTPWACRDLERFESMKFDNGGKK